jgi:hypothetical protein
VARHRSRMDDATPTGDPQTLTVLGAARRLALHPATVARAARRGDLPSTWSFHRRVIAVTDLDAWVASKAMRTGGRP